MKSQYHEAHEAVNLNTKLIFDVYSTKVSTHNKPNTLQQTLIANIKPTSTKDMTDKH